MQYIGHPERGYGGFVFSTEKKTHHLQELAVASLITMTTGKTYIHAAHNFLLDTQELLIPHLWFTYLLYTATPPDEAIVTLSNTKLQRKIRELEKHSTPIFPLVTIGYPDTMQVFYETFHPEWKPLPISEEHATEYVLKYRLARTKTSDTVQASLLFSDPTHAYIINTNELLQLAIGLALTAKEQDTHFAAEMRSIPFKCDPLTTKECKKENTPAPKSIYCIVK